MLVEETFDAAWVKAVRCLSEHGWEAYNLVVHIKDSSRVDDALHTRVTTFLKENGFCDPRHVSHTVFPAILYRWNRDAEKLFERYNASNGFYSRVAYRARKKGQILGWGTYFRRMTHYEIDGKVVNQLANIISAIKSDGSRTYSAAYTVVIPKPGPETARRRGGPCLGYLALQVERGMPRVVNLLAVYRNHDFLHKAYGNYWGLCDLVSFLAQETNCRAGALTCVSSHAYVQEGRRQLRDLISRLL